MGLRSNVSVPLILRNQKRGVPATLATLPHIEVYLEVTSREHVPTQSNGALPIIGMRHTEAAISWTTALHVVPASQEQIQFNAEIIVQGKQYEEAARYEREKTGIVTGTASGAC